MPTQSIEFSGFTCDACVKLTTITLRRMPGVKNLSVEPNGMAQIEADRFISLEEIKRVFEQTRYRVVNVAVNH